MSLLHEKDVTLSSYIAGGNFGEVWKGKYKGKVVAVKKPKGGEVKSETLADFINLLKLSHPNIVKLEGIYVDSKHGFCMVMEYLPYTLEDCVKNKKQIDVLNVVKGIAKGMEYMHANRTIHRDIKETNILITESGEAKIADFGIARAFPTLQTLKDADMTKAGTGMYMAPEIRSNRFDEKVDVYSFGVLVGNLKNQLDLDREEGEFMEQLCEDCKRHSPAKRPSFTDIVARVEKAQDSISKPQKVKKVPSKSVTKQKRFVLVQRESDDESDSSDLESDSDDDSSDSEDSDSEEEMDFAKFFMVSRPSKRKNDEEPDVKPIPKLQKKEGADGKLSTNPYLLFSSEKRESVKAMFPKMTPSEIIQQLSGMWNALKDDAKEKYKKQAALNKKAKQAEAKEAARKKEEKEEDSDRTLLYEQSVRASSSEVAQLVNMTMKDLKQYITSKKKSFKAADHKDTLVVRALAAGGYNSDVKKYLVSKRKMELQMLCQELGLSTNANKSDLIEDIEQNLL